MFGGNMILAMMDRASMAKTGQTFRQSVTNRVQQRMADSGGPLGVIGRRKKPAQPSANAGRTLLGGG